MLATNLDLLTLIDAYAAARAARDDAYSNAAGWAFEADHRDMLAARAAVAAALDITNPPPLADPISASAALRSAELGELAS